MKYKDQIFSDLSIYIVDSKRSPLMGREWFEKLGFRILDVQSETLAYPVYFTGDNYSLLQELVPKFPAVFSNRLDKFKKGEASLVT